MKPINETRKQNLESLSSEHGGDEKLAELLGISPSQLSDDISDFDARSYESKLGLAANWLDLEH